MKFDTICYIFETPVLAAYYQRYGVAELESQGLKVRFIDASPILHPIAYDKIKTGLIDSQLHHVTPVFSRREYRELLKSMTDGVFLIFTMSFYYGDYFLFSAIPSRLRYGFMCHIDMIPEIHRADQSRIRISEYIKKFSWNRMMQTVFHRLPKRFFPSRKADLIFFASTGNEDMLKSLVFADNQTQVVYLSAIDYNEYAKVCQNTERLVKEPYIVFLDQYYPYHPDGRELGINVDPVIYYGEVNRFLREASRILNCRAIIAAHPRSDYETHKDAYGDLPIFKFKTCQLIRDAEMVFSHASTSLAYVLLAGKPLVMIATNDVLRYTPVFQDYADIPRAQIINISDESIYENLAEKLHVKPDLDHYDEMVRKYLKRDYVRGAPPSDFFADMIQAVNDCYNTSYASKGEQP